ALDLNPTYPVPLINAGELLSMQARYQVRSGQDATATVAAARRRIEPVLTSDQYEGEAAVRMAVLALGDAEAAPRAGRPVATATAEARRWSARARAHDAAEGAPDRLDAAADLLEIRDAVRRGQNVAALLAHCRATLDRAAAREHDEAE